MSSSESVTLAPPPLPQPRLPRAWKFIGTSLWGLAVFIAMFAGQLSVLAYFVLTDPSSKESREVDAIFVPGDAK